MLCVISNWAKDDDGGNVPLVLREYEKREGFKFGDLTDQWGGPSIQPSHLLACVVDGPADMLDAIAADARFEVMPFELDAEPTAAELKALAKIDKRIEKLNGKTTRRDVLGTLVGKLRLQGLASGNDEAKEQIIAHEIRRVEDAKPHEQAEHVAALHSRLVDAGLLRDDVADTQGRYNALIELRIKFRAGKQPTEDQRQITRIRGQLSPHELVDHNTRPASDSVEANGVAPSVEASRRRINKAAAVYVAPESTGENRPALGGD
jgi:hypothetical protein